MAELKKKKSKIHINALISESESLKNKIMDLEQLLRDSKIMENYCPKDVKAFKACMDKEKYVIVDVCEFQICYIP